MKHIPRLKGDYRSVFCISDTYHNDQILTAVDNISAAFIAIKSVVSTSPTDIVAGAIGMIDEIFLGYLTADAILSVGTMGQEYFEELLKNIGQSSGG